MNDEHTTEWIKIVKTIMIYGSNISIQEMILTITILPSIQCA